MIHKPKQLDSTFVEIENNNHKNITGLTEKHTTLENQDFLNCYMLSLFDNREKMLLDSTNNLRYCNTDRKITQFVDEIYSNSFIP